MPTGDLTAVLVKHDAWATRQILQACERMPLDQFAQPFDMGPGSLRATLTHIISAMRRWTDVLAKRPPRPRLDQNGVAYSPAELLQLLDEAAGEFASIARSHPMDETVTHTLQGKQFTFTRAAVVAQVTTHAMHHRAQCLNMLRQLGVSPLPISSVAEWAVSGER